MPKCILRTLYTSTLSASIYGSQSLLTLFALQIAHLCSSPSRTSYCINHSCPLVLSLICAKCSFAVHRIFFAKFLFHMAKDRSYKFSKLHDISKTTRGNFHASRWRLGDPPFGIFCWQVITSIRHTTQEPDYMVDRFVEAFQMQAVREFFYANIFSLRSMVSRNACLFNCISCYQSLHANRTF